MTTPTIPTDAFTVVIDHDAAGQHLEIGADGAGCVWLHAEDATDRVDLTLTAAQAFALITAVAQAVTEAMQDGERRG